MRAARLLHFIFLFEVSVSVSSWRTIRLAEGTEDVTGSKKIVSKSKSNVAGTKELVLSRPPTPLSSGQAGPLLPLYGHCFKFNDSRYKYSFCPFHNITQTEVAKKNRFILGVWENWHEHKAPVASSSEAEGAPVTATAAAPERAVSFAHQVYTDGDQCALLPRRTSVALLCGADDFKVGELAEPSTCNYTLSFWVPVPCALLPGAVDAAAHAKAAARALEVAAGKPGFWGRVLRRGTGDGYKRQRWPWQAPPEGSKEAALEAEVKELKGKLKDCQKAKKR